MKTPQIIDQATLDRISLQAKQSPRRRKNFNFHESENARSHRLLNAIEPGTYIPPHRHLDPHKDESMLMVRGRMGALFFDADGNVTQQVVLGAGGAAVGINIPHGVFHSLVALEPGTVFFESKAGPYAMLTADERAPWAPQEGAPEAGAYLAWMEKHFS